MSRDVNKKAGVGRRASEDRTSGVGRRASGRSDRLRPLNVPERVVVTLDAAGQPANVEKQNGGRWASGVGKVIEAIGETWRVDDEWWRAPIVRRYYEVVLEGGGRMILFEDLVTREWFVQRP